MNEGVIFHPSRGEDPYGSQEIKNGDIVTLKVEQGVLSFIINDVDQGKAYEDDALTGDDLVPFVKLGKGDSVIVLTGEIF